MHTCRCTFSTFTTCTCACVRSSIYMCMSEITHGISILVLHMYNTIVVCFQSSGDCFAGYAHKLVWCMCASLSASTHNICLHGHTVHVLVSLSGERTACMCWLATLRRVQLISSLCSWTLPRASPSMYRTGMEILVGHTPFNPHTLSSPFSCLLCCVFTLI